MKKRRLIIQESNDLIGIGRSQNKSTPDTLYNNILLIRNHLKTLFKGEEEKLREWGYDVEIFQIRDLRIASKTWMLPATARQQREYSGLAVRGFQHKIGGTTFGE